MYKQSEMIQTGLAVKSSEAKQNRKKWIESAGQ